MVIGCRMLVGVADARYDDRWNAGIRVFHMITRGKEREKTWEMGKMGNLGN
jgi:hypothetical protein